MIHDGHLFALAVYVDDCLLIGKRSTFLTLFKRDFSSRFKIEDLSSTSWILGCSIIRYRSRGTLHLNQTRYLKDVFSEFGMSECTPVSTPMSAKSSKSVYVALDIREMPYAKLIGNLLYASNCTRPDITASVNYLSRYMSHHGVEHWLQAKRLLRYLKDTIDKGLIFIGLFRILQLPGRIHHLLMDHMVNRILVMWYSCVDPLLLVVPDFNLLWLCLSWKPNTWLYVLQLRKSCFSDNF
jgi:hypothetical protein